MDQAAKLTIPDEEFSAIAQSRSLELANEWKHGDISAGFAQWVTELVSGLPEDDAFNASYVGSAGHDHGLDSMWRDDDTLFLVQAKGTQDFKPKTFGETTIDDFLRCLTWLQNPTASPETSSYEFQRASQRYRQAVEDNCKVRLVLVVLGELSPDAKRRLDLEQNRVARSFLSHSLEVMSFWDLKEEYLTNLVLEEDFKEAVSLKVQSKQQFEKDVDSLRAIVVTVPAKEFRRIYGDYGRRLFFYNVRYFLKNTPVNRAIMSTLRDDSQYKAAFWHLNNGIVIVCDRMEWQNEEQTELLLVAPQIVNGCQTVVSLAEADSKGYHLENVDILTRIIQTSDREFALKITQATNTQNANTSRDLASNEPEQVRLQGLFASLKPPYFYQRKRKEFESLDRSAKTMYTDSITGKPRLLDNPDVAGAYLSFAKQMPSEARTRARELFDVTRDIEGKESYYSMIFSGERTAEEYLLPTLLAQKVELYLRDFRRRRNAFEQIVKRKLKSGEILTAEEENQVEEFRGMEALPYAKTQILGLVHELIVAKYGIYDAGVAKSLLAIWNERPKLYQDLIDYAVYTIISHTNTAQSRDPTIDFDNAYKLVRTYQELVHELRRRLSDKFLKSPLDELPDIPKAGRPGS